jgi:hypothetical protein
MFCLSQDFKDLDIYLRIADSTTESLRNRIDDITGFEGL